MSVLKHYRLLRLILVLLAVVAQCIALENMWLLLVSGTLVLLSWYFTEGPKSQTFPKWLSRIAVVVALIFTLFNTQLTSDNLPQVLGQFFVWLTVIKLFGGRSAENDAQELLLCLVLMTLAGLYATDLIFGILLVCWGGLAAWVFMMYQLYYGVETMRIERYAAVPTSYGVPWTRPVTGQKVQIVFRRTAFGMLLLGFILSTAFFFLIPRGFTDDTRHLGKVDGGVSRLDLSPIRDLTIRKQQIMVVQLVDEEGVVFQLPEPLRLRGSVLDLYEGKGVWVSSSRFETRQLKLKTDSFTSFVDRDDSTLFTMHVSLQRPSKIVYSLYQPVGIETDEATLLFYDMPLHTMRFSSTSTFPKHYSVKVDLQRYIASDSAMMQTGRYENDAVTELATGLLEEEKIDTTLLQGADEEVRTKVSQIFVDYLTSNAFQYSTDNSLLEPEEYAFMNNHEDPAEAFLLTMQSGHCEYFAASMVAMCDTVGLPARIVTGYLTDRWDETSQQYIVLDSDAHAWVETEVADGLWRAFDPTPPADGSPTAHQSLGWLESLRFAWIRLDREWKLGVLGFDADNQRHLVESMFPLWREQASMAWDNATTMGATVVNWFDIGSGGLLWIVLVASSVVGASIVIVIVVGRRKRVRNILSLHIGVPTSTVVNVEFYAEVVQLLITAGFIRPAWQPTKSWINSLQLSEDASGLLCTLTEKYYQIRFGGVQLSRSQRLVISGNVSRFATALRKESL
jgi:transglutaminase-like putative cysteine protease